MIHFSGMNLMVALIINLHVNCTSFIPLCNQQLDISMPEALVVSEILLFKNDMTNEKLDSESSMECMKGKRKFKMGIGRRQQSLLINDVSYKY